VSAWLDSGGGCVWWLPDGVTESDAICHAIRTVDNDVLRSRSYREPLTLALAEIGVRPAPPSNPHCAPANRKERPWHPPRERAPHPLSDYPAGMTIDPEAQRSG
jgi:hypothetical protein